MQLFLAKTGFTRKPICAEVFYAEYNYSLWVKAKLELKP